MKRLFIVLAVLSCTGLNAYSQAVKYRGNVGIVNQTSMERERPTAGMQLLTAHGIELSDAWFLGLGTGIKYDYYNSILSLPVFFESQYNVRLKEWTVYPFVGARTGMVFSNEADYSDGVFVSAFFGVAYKRWSFNVGYENQISFIQTTIPGVTGETIRINQSYRREPGLFMGVSFVF
jgi:hypothetical protein